MAADTSELQAEEAEGCCRATSRRSLDFACTAASACHRKYLGMVEAFGGGQQGHILVGILSLLYAGMAVVVLSIVVDSLLPSPRRPEYSVAVAGVRGLDAGPTATTRIISPVLNVTVHIGNPDERYGDDACVCRHSDATVSYGGVVLGSGLVPPACARPTEKREVAATVFGLDVVLPRAMRDRLAPELPRREAVVDVAVTTPTGCYTSRRPRRLSWQGELLLACKAKIGGPRSPCSVTGAYSEQLLATDVRG